MYEALARLEKLTKLELVHCNIFPTVRTVPLPTIADLTLVQPINRPLLNHYFVDGHFRVDHFMDWLFGKFHSAHTLTLVG